MTSGETKLTSSWGRTSISHSRYWQPSCVHDTTLALHSAGRGGVIARGYGRSYGDECMNDGGAVIEMTALNTIQSFNDRTGVICCDAGVSYQTLMEHCVPRGWIPPVCPGTAFVSMGGAIANDVHGKNEHLVGTFADHVDWFDLMMPSGEVRRVRASAQDELFRATVGGIGLTGIVVAVQLQLQRAVTNAFDVTETRVHDLDAFLEVLTDSPAGSHVVGWIDALSRGKQLGRGVLQRARSAEANVPVPSTRHLSVPVDLPAHFLNHYAMTAFNAMYFHRIPVGGRQRRMHANAFLYPLDRVHNWNRSYGRSGVYQFQCVVPLASARTALIRIMESVTKARSASFLAVIKRMSRPGGGMLSFAQPGISLALDFPRRAPTFGLLQGLHEIVAQHGGRIYLAKDAALSREHFQSMYPRFSEFESVVNRHDPDGVMQSDMSRRLGLAHPHTANARRS